MDQKPINSLQRVLITLSHQEADRVPFFLLLTMHGAKELGISIRKYFSNAESVAKGQLLMRQKYRHDCLYNFFYASVEVEAWGGEVIYVDDGPPNAGAPFIRNHDDIARLSLPQVKDTPCLVKVLNATRIMKENVGDEVPIIGVVMSPFSLPVMQMGFPAYLELIYDEPQLFKQLMAINQDFCVEWANAQLQAGATAICYFDPVSSTTIIPRELYLKTGYPIAKSTISRIHGPTATHMASGRCLPIAEDIAQTGTAVLGVSAEEDIEDIKRMCSGKLTVLGNLNGIEMSGWNMEQTAASVKEVIAKAASGGGFILSDNHGEIPWQVQEDVLMTLSETVHTFGRYPIVREE
ncbi:MAG: uroporphyrinogen decarboxylase family protein [Nitrospirae bacterium]|nr:uroporphyrinogen decarboxylase family protein [Nitrospirota bacterium]MBF0553296.1 uroporphyrinogen decarboxylase family protein [Nitrospirota bacterium]